MRLPLVLPGWLCLLPVSLWTAAQQKRKVNTKVSERKMYQISPYEPTNHLLWLHSHHVLAGFLLSQFARYAINRCMPNCPSSGTQHSERWCSLTTLQSNILSQRIKKGQPLWRESYELDKIINEIHHISN